MGNRDHVEKSGKSQRKTQRVAHLAASAIAVFSCVAACGLSEGGLGGNLLATEDAATFSDGETTGDSALTVDGEGADSANADGASTDATTTDADTSTDGAVDASVDAKLDANDACVPVTAADIMLNKLTTEGDAKYMGTMLKLTPGGNSKDGAAWLPTTQIAGTSYDFDFTILAPNAGETTGDGFSFALISDATTPTTGGNGENYGLCGLAGASGFAVVIDTYDNADDNNDNSTTNLKLISVANGVCSFVMAEGSGTHVDDSNPHEITVNITSAGAVTATLVNPKLTVSSSTLTIPSGANLYLGFTGATGGGSNSTHEIDSASSSITCK